LQAQLVNAIQVCDNKAGVS